VPEYNGWKNRQTWNVALWIQNDEPLYRSAVAYMEKHPDSRHPYYNFIKSEGLLGEKTPDGYKWDSQILDYDALNDMMRELV